MVKKKKGEKGIKQKPSKNVPTKLRVISILFYVFAVFSFLLGLILLAVGIGGGAYIESIGSEAFINQILELNPESATEIGALSSEDIGLFKSMLLVVGIVGGIVTIALGVLYIFVGRGLMRRKKWAWITAIVLVCLGLLRYIIGGIFGGGYSIFMLVILLVVGYFLIIDKEIRKIFLK